MKNDTIAEVIALLNTANYDTDTLNQKRDEVVSTLKKQLSIQRVSKSLPERKGRCCGRCDGVHDLCFGDMTCDVHNVLGCEDCYGKR
ncbi:hypothetical protein [Mesoflavibacter sp. CH_XMU1422-2]|uniref:hypothetical protein n=1 Tax=Mesoflavibacter sp. CH_XMU1422-2 TaxID=3107770 RepID=UPI0030084665